MKQNNVVNFLAIVGFLIFAVGGIGGFISGEGIIIVWPIALMAGSLFLAFAELIELIDTKLQFANNRLNNLENLLKSTSFVDDSVIEEHQEDSKREGQWKNSALTSGEEQFIRDFYSKQVKVLYIIKTPFEDHCLVKLENGETKIVDISGFKPIEKKPEEWGPELRLWYEDNHKF